MRILFIESSYDSGHQNLRMGRGPGFLLRSGVAAALADRGHEIQHSAVDLGPGCHPEIVSSVEIMKQVGRAVSTAEATGFFPVTLSGNCSAAVGAVSGLHGDQLGLLWFDAHGDLHTADTTGSGFFDGTSFAMLLGKAWPQLASTIPGFRPIPSSRVALVGGRDLDGPELRHLDQWAISHYSTADCKSSDLLGSLAAFAERLDSIYLHIDLDVLDPSELVANAFTCPGGLSLKQLLHGLTIVGERTTVRGLGLASYDPSTDKAGRGPSVVESILQTTLGTRDLQP